MEELIKIRDLMVNGNWGDAIRKYKNLKLSPADFAVFYDSLSDEEDKRDFAILGYYTRGEIK